MKTPTRSESPKASIRRSRRLIQTCQSIPDISGLVATYEGAVTSFEGRYNDWDLARSQASVALAKQHEAEAALDEEMRGVGLIILKVSRGSRSSPTYQNYFPRGFKGVLNFKGERALHVSAGLLASMGNETNQQILAHREGLEAARAQLESAFNARLAAADVRQQAKAVLEEAKYVWRCAHNDFYFARRSRFPGKRKWVESLFRVTGRFRAPEEEQSDEADEVSSDTEAGAKPDPSGSQPSAQSA